VEVSDKCQSNCNINCAAVNAVVRNTSRRGIINNGEVCFLL
jgi:hypothetical protein